MLAMATEKKRRRGRPPEEKPSKVVLGAKVDADLADRLGNLVDAFNSRHNLETDKSAHIVRAIREYCDRLASEVQS